MQFTMNEHDACGIGAVVQIDGTKSYKVVDQALQIVEKLEHRAGKDASGKVGDGVGILLQIPHAFFSTLPFDLGNEREYGVGMFFFPQDTLKRSQAMKLFETICEKKGMEFIGWREVPCDPDLLGEAARECMPYLMQGFVRKPADVEKGLPFDQKLYVIRREFEKCAKDTYVASLSSRTIVYKGMFLVDQLRRFYFDLQDERCQSSIAIVHSRFSTNTTPSWRRAHPNRLIAHNGEINTIQGNENRMLAREESMNSPFTNQFYQEILPVMDVTGSDSARLDNTLEYFMMNGMDLVKALMITIPEPYKHTNMEQDKYDFYHYYATMMEPWDGPAAIVFSDGDIVGAQLDRNGLRPARYYITKDNMLVLSSEVGVLDVPASRIAEKSRLEPGKMLVIDTAGKGLIKDEDLKKKYADAHPYGEWLHQNLLHLKDLKAPDKKSRMHTQKQRDSLYKFFGYTYEDMKEQILPMARTNKEPIASMGTDIPLAPFSKLHPSLFQYFKQLFAQVTNPPIDSLREEIVTDTTVYIGSDGNLLHDEGKNCRVLEIEHPILDCQDMDKIKNLHKDGFQPYILSTLFYRGMPLKDAIDHLFVEADRAYRDGANIFILSDRGVDESHMAIPSLLAVSALEQHLIRTKKKTAVSIIVESGEPKRVHDFACLLGYGASAVYPYLAHECIQEMIDLDILDKEPSNAVASYNNAVLNGIVKIASKMGISTLQSYQGAQIFEAIGIHEDVISDYFTNTVSRVGGITLNDIENDIVYHHDKAFDPLGLGMDTSLDSIGFHKLRSGENKEDHLYDPKTIVLLQKACQQGDYDLFRQYSERLNAEHHPHTLRSCMEFCYDREPVSLDEVESVASIVRRFKTGAMSYGSISQEAHECMAVAMNTIGGKSNSGEGGEIESRLGTIRNSAIKQVASGRFGVTSEYLVSAQEIQIKMAQGAKPGEGGHLPGNKVYPWIAKTRCSTPGVTLISPPPHHDIYSIEDLAQLIYDLKCANDDARISVKLVSESGVGTIACGVAKAGAQVILISGLDGGTGAAPQSSIHHAGLPWELGVIETHHALLENNLRDKVFVETDGKLMTGRDVAAAALLGAEEFGFATAPLVTMGCRMMRVCNLDTCPFGIATQNVELRKRFKGKPEYVIHFMEFVAQELREIMASLGFRTVDEMVGHSECLKIRKSDESSYHLERLARMIGESAPLQEQKKVPFDFKLEQTIDKTDVIPAFRPYMKKNARPHEERFGISSLDRAFGTQFGAEVTRKYKNSLAEDTFVLHLHGVGGQSFGAFIPAGVTFDLKGDANDYFGKGLSGGKLAVSVEKDAAFKADENVIIGNVALYGATSGKAFINGKAGERFCVRNSGAQAVVEGCGDHALEYMTGGTVLILGRTGKNVAAGMSGGIAYIYDEEHDLYKRLNDELVDMENVEHKQDVEAIGRLLEEHVKMTGSAKGKYLLDHFDEVLVHFKKIIPRDYKKIKTEIKRLEDLGFDHEEAQLRAFEAAHA
ncbi:glutamate synthase large subunit [uncultured Dubosiella sp.]|uniref:glutamate synthase large subunit n=5 Tax=uncultured Dubosiella sp. TaxID=1937011 RepID=UPI0025F7E48F|nr:glutamate synthase large subunit [uncultured Dubosiella sp.]